MPCSCSESHTSASRNSTREALGERRPGGMAACRTYVRDLSVTTYFTSQPRRSVGFSISISGTCADAARSCSMPTTSCENSAQLSGSMLKKLEGARFSHGMGPSRLQGALAAIFRCCWTLRCQLNFLLTGTSCWRIFLHTRSSSIGGAIARLRDSEIAIDRRRERSSCDRLTHELGTDCSNHGSAATSVRDSGRCDDSTDMKSVASSV